VLNSDYKDMLQVLLDHGVKFLLVGAYAMAAFGAPLHEIDETTFVTPGVVFQIGVAPRRIDIITAISGVGFREAYEQSRVVEIEEMPIPILSLSDLIRNKRATGRDKDRLDADRLEGGRP
jgi:hypothetical protein